MNHDSGCVILAPTQRTGTFERERTHHEEDQQNPHPHRYRRNSGSRPPRRSAPRLREPRRQRSAWHLRPRGSHGGCLGDDASASSPRDCPTAAGGVHHSGHTGRLHAYGDIRHPGACGCERASASADLVRAPAPAALLPAWASASAALPSPPPSARASAPAARAPPPPPLTPRLPRS